MKTSQMLKSISVLLLLLFKVESSYSECTPPSDFSVFTPSASQIGATSVSLSWVNTFRHNSFTIQIRLTGGTYSNVATVSSSQTSYTVSGLQRGTTYEFRVLANYTCCDDGGGGGGGTEPLLFVCEDHVWPSTNSVTAITEPPIPTIRSASSITSSGFVARWYSSTGASSYVLRVKRGTTTVYGPTDVGDVTSEGIGSLDPGEAYTYQVYAKNSSGSSSYSTSASVETLAEVPITKSPSSVTQNSARIEWNAANGASGYSYYFYEGSSLAASGTTTNLYVDRTGLDPGTVYKYRVRSRNDNGSLSGYSSYQTFTTIPADPVANVASSLITGGFTANWALETGATGYEVDVSKSTDFDPLVTTVSLGNVSSTAFSGLDPGEVYYYRARAKNTSGTSGNSNVISVETLAEVPVAVSPTNITQTSARLNWNAAAGATDYQYSFYDEAVSFLDGDVTDQLFFDIASKLELSPGTSYQYRVRSRNDNEGLSEFSNYITFITVPATPVTTEASEITQTSFKARWNAATGAASYLVDISTSTDFDTDAFIMDQPVSETSLIIQNAGLQPGTTYFYRVRAVNESGVSPYSDVRSVETLADVPVISSPSSITPSSFRANWVVSSGSSGYHVEVADDASFDNLIAGYDPLVVSGGSTSFADINGLSAGGTYFYRVRSTNAAGGASAPSVHETVVLVPGEPVALDPVDIAQTSFTAKWDVVEGATDYELDVSQDDAGFSPGALVLDRALISGGTTASYSVSNLDPGRTYYYRIKGKNDNGKSDYSNAKSALLIPADPDTPTTSHVSTDSMLVSWPSRTGATTYRLEIAEDIDFNIPVSGYPAVVAALSDTVKGLATGTAYFFKLTAINITGESGESPVGSVFTIPSAPMVDHPSSAEQSSFTAHWNGVQGATGYNLDVDTTKVFTSELLVTEAVNGGTTISKLVEPLEPGLQYFYRVSATNESGESEHSGLDSVLLKPANPMAPASSNVQLDGFTLTWDPVIGATAYELEVSETLNFGGDRISGYNPAILTTTSETLEGLQAGKKYYYRLLAKNLTGKSGSSPADSVVTNPPAPVIEAPGFPTQTSFVANWSVSMGATGYNIDVDTTKTFDSGLAITQPVSGGTTTSYLVEGLEAGLSYYCRVSAINTDGESGHSGLDSVLLVPANPEFPVPSATSQDSVVLSWDAVTGADSYLLEVALDDEFNSLLSEYPKVTPELADTVKNLDAGTVYYFRLSATNETGTSGYSLPDFVTTVPPVPLIGTASSQQQTSFVANWESASGATAYHLDVDTTELFNSTLNFTETIVGGTTSSHQVSSLEAGLMYYYRVSALNESGESGHSLNASAQLRPEDPAVPFATEVGRDTVILNWDAVQSATAYQMEVGLDADFTQMITGYPKITDALADTVRGLDAGTKYFFRLIAINSSGGSGYSPVGDIVLVPAEPVTTSVTDIGESGFTAQWVSAKGAEKYYLQVGDDSDFSSLVSGYESLEVTDTTQAVSGLVLGETYYYRVKAGNSNGLSGYSDTRSVFLLGSPGDLISENISQFQAGISWSSVAGSEGYLLFVSESEDFSSTLSGYDGKDLTETETSITDLASGTTYYWKVQAKNNSGTSEDSEIAFFTTVPAEPVIKSVSDLSASGFVVHWDVELGATSYRIDVALGEDFLTPLVVSDELIAGGENSSYSLSGIEAGATCFIRLRAANINGTSANSEIYQVTTLAASPVAGEASNITQGAFTANWNIAAGADAYRLDVSTSENFEAGTLIEEALEVTETSETISNLNVGHTYYYRVRSVNLVDSLSDYSAAERVLLLPPTPVVASAKEITSTGFAARWERLEIVTGYSIELSTAEDFVTVEQAIDVTDTSYAFTGLNAGDTYYYRLRSSNASGYSLYSGIIMALLVAPDPVGLEAGNVTKNRFDLLWEESLGADSYTVQISEREDFNGLVTDQEVTGATLEISGLQAGTTYFARVKANNQSGTSGFSEPLKVVTYPEVPGKVSFPESGIGSDKFTVSWTGVVGADHYEVLIAKNDPEFSTGNLVGEYVPKRLPSSPTVLGVSDVEPGTFYWVKIRAVNAAGKTVYSDANLVTTQTPSGGTEDSRPEITSISYNEPEKLLAFNAHSRLGDVVSLIFRYKPISKSVFNEVALDIKEDETYQVTLEDSWTDMLGMDYEIEVTDLIGQKALKTGQIKEAPGQVLIYKEQLSFGTSLSNYRMISVPYDIGTTIGQIFLDNLGSVNKKEWRLVRYEDGRNKDFEEISFKQMERGKAYWFVSADSLNLDFGHGNAPDNTLDEPFELNLEAGWNQIGNPFPFEVNWTDILEYNSDKDGVGTDYLTYGHSGDQFSTGSQVLKPYGGGFVFAEEAVTLLIPVDIEHAAEASTGRMVHTVEGREAGWELPLAIRQGETGNLLSGIGMHPEAQLGLDRYDMVNPPRFIKYTHLLSKSDGPVSLARSIVPSAEEHVWFFEVDQNVGNMEIDLSWDPVTVVGRVPSASLFLYDPGKGRLVNMLKETHYRMDAATDGIVIYFTQANTDFLSGMENLNIGTPYPNPAAGPVRFPYHLSFDDSGEVTATLKIFDQAGKMVYETVHSERSKGLNELVWHGRSSWGDQLKTGIYYYHLVVNGKGVSRTINGKIIRE